MELLNKFMGFSFDFNYLIKKIFENVIEHKFLLKINVVS